MFVQIFYLGTIRTKDWSNFDRSQNYQGFALRKCTHSFRSMSHSISVPFERSHSDRFWLRSISKRLFYCLNWIVCHFVALKRKSRARVKAGFPLATFNLWSILQITFLCLMTPRQLERIHSTAHKTKESDPTWHKSKIVQHCFNTPHCLTPPDFRYDLGSILTQYVYWVCTLQKRTVKNGMD